MEKIKRKMSEEHKRKISIALIGNKNGIGNEGNKNGNGVWLKKHRNLFVGEKNPFYGKHHTEENKYKSAWARGLKGEDYLSHYENGKQLFGGKNLLDETKQKRIEAIRKTHKGKTYEELHGVEKAKELRKMRSDKTKELLGKVPGMGFPKDGTMKIRRSKQIFPMKDTQIEVKIEGFLKLLGIEYDKHFYLNFIRDAYQCDFIIPMTKTIIECDGDYWHGNPIKFSGDKLKEFQIQQREEDERRTKQLTDHGYKVIRLWETDIKNLQVEQFKEILNG